MGHRLILVALVATLPLFGCMPQPANWFGAETATAAREFTREMAKQGIWDRLLARVRGHVNEPGIVSMARVTVEIGGRVIGADGDVWIEGDGYGREARSDPVRRQILDMWKNEDITDDQAMDWLGRPRVDSAQRGPLPSTTQPAGGAKP